MTSDQTDSSSWSVFWLSAKIQEVAASGLRVSPAVYLRRPVRPDWVGGQWHSVSRIQCNCFASNRQMGIGIWW